MLQNIFPSSFGESGKSNWTWKLGWMLLRVFFSPCRIAYTLNEMTNQIIRLVIECRFRWNSPKWYTMMNTPEAESTKQQQFAGERRANIFGWNYAHICTIAVWLEVTWGCEVNNSTRTWLFGEFLWSFHSSCQPFLIQCIISVAKFVYSKSKIVLNLLLHWRIWKACLR